MIARVWTDELPKCAHTSAAVRGGDAPDDSLSFFCQINENSCLYGVFEPHNGVEAARFILQRMAAEIIFYPLGTASDEDICELLRNAFLSVEKAYVENYDEMIAERTSLQYQLQTLTDTEISDQNCDRILNRLKEIDQHLSGGATVVIALVNGNKLFVANVGESRALLCKTDDNSVLRVVQLSAEHSLNNEDELLRLSQLQVNVERLASAQGLGNQQSTRCLGNYLVKGLYRAFPDLRSATSEPVIPTAEIHGPITLDQSCRFLVLLSSVVYKRLQEVRGTNEQINKQLAQIIVENFRQQASFRNMSQAVLQEVEDQFMTHCMKHALTPKSFAPMTLMIRNFNFPMPNAQNESRMNTQDTTSGLKGQNVRFNPIVQSKSHTLLNAIDSESSLRNDSRQMTIDSQMSTNQTTSSESSDVYPNRLPYDKDRKIKGYVDFTCFYENVEKARQNGTLPSFIL